jgi:hypothetical protein
MQAKGANFDAAINAVYFEKSPIFSGPIHEG